MNFLQNELLYAEVEYMQKRVSESSIPLLAVVLLFYFIFASSNNYMWRSFCFQEMDLQSDNMYLRSKVTACFIRAQKFLGPDLFKPIID